MTLGAVIIALGADYLRLAAWNARRIQRYLGISVSVITDQPTQDPVFDRVIVVQPVDQPSLRWFPDHGTTVPWHNHDRADAWHLSPYDRTLLLDADYVISSDSLLAVLHNSEPVQCFRVARDAATGQDLTDLNHMGAHRLPMAWATVVAFDRSDASRWVFDAWRQVQQHWQHYRDIYHIRDPLFRNDYALTMALGMMSGHTFRIAAIPWRLMTLLPDADFDFDPSSDTWNLRSAQRRSRITGQDLHVMGKRRLAEIVCHAA